MNDFQYEILKLLKENNGLPYIDVINACNPHFSDAKSALNVLGRQNLVKFSNPDTTNSFVSLTDEGDMEVLSYTPQKTTTEEIQHQTIANTYTQSHEKVPFYKDGVFWGAAGVIVSVVFGIAQFFF